MSSPEYLIQKYREAGEAYGRAKAEAATMEHYRHVVLANQVALARARGEKTLGGQENEARRSPEYALHLDSMKTAIMTAEIRKADLKAAEYEIEMFRTAEASKRMERKAYAA